MTDVQSYVLIVNGPMLLLLLLLQVEALLHGHSYTAYPVGCAAAMASLSLLQSTDLNPNLCRPDIPGRCRKQAASSSSSSSGCCSQPCGELLPMWDELAAAIISHHPRVAGVVVLGSVLAVELAAGDQGAGAGRYGSAAAVDVVAWLRERGVAARPLGPVVYMMATPTSSREKCDWLLRQLSEVLDQEEGIWAAAAAAGVGNTEGVLI
jgi:dethiobiotin synthetase/adenosylmethionine--8-amino-7-oxononanoate aminotransferase